MIYLLLVLGAIATWRVSHMLLRENGPFEAFRLARVMLGVKYRGDSDTVIGWKYEITTCIWCLSMWIGGLFTLIIWLSVEIPWAATLMLPYVFSASSVVLDQLFGLNK